MILSFLGCKRYQKRYHKLYRVSVQSSYASIICVGSIPHPFCAKLCIVGLVWHVGRHSKELSLYGSRFGLYLLGYSRLVSYILRLFCMWVFCILTGLVWTPLLTMTSPQLPRIYPLPMAINSLVRRP